MIGWEDSDDDGWGEVTRVPQEDEEDLAVIDTTGRVLDRDSEDAAAPMPHVSCSACSRGNEVDTSAGGSEVTDHNHEVSAVIDRFVGKSTRVRELLASPSSSPPRSDSRALNHPPPSVSFRNVATEQKHASSRAAVTASPSGRRLVQPLSPTERHGVSPRSKTQESSEVHIRPGDAKRRLIIAGDEEPDQLLPAAATADPDIRHQLEVPSKRRHAHTETQLPSGERKSSDASGRLPAKPDRDAPTHGAARSDQPPERALDKYRRDSAQFSQSRRDSAESYRNRRGSPDDRNDARRRDESDRYSHEGSLSPTPSQAQRRVSQWRRDAAMVEHELKYHDERRKQDYDYVPRRDRQGKDSTGIRGEPRRVSDEDTHRQWQQELTPRRRPSLLPPPGSVWASYSDHFEEGFRRGKRADGFPVLHHRSSSSRAVRLEASAQHEYDRDVSPPHKRRFEAMPPPHFGPHPGGHEGWPSAPASGDKQRRVGYRDGHYAMERHAWAADDQMGEEDYRHRSSEGLRGRGGTKEANRRPKRNRRWPAPERMRERGDYRPPSHLEPGRSPSSPRSRSPVRPHSTRLVSREAAPEGVQGATMAVSAGTTADGEALLFPEFGGGSAVAIPLPASNGDSIGRLMLSFEAKSLDILRYRAGFSSADFLARTPTYLASHYYPHLLPPFLRASLDDPLVAEDLKAYMGRVAVALSTSGAGGLLTPAEAAEKVPHLPLASSSPAIAMSTPCPGTPDSSHVKASESLAVSSSPPLTAEPAIGRGEDRLHYPPELVSYYLDEDKVRGDHADKYKPLNKRFDFITRTHLWCLRPQSGLSGRRPTVAVGHRAATSQAGNVNRSVELNADIMNVWTVLMQDWHDELYKIAARKGGTNNEGPEGATALRYPTRRCWFLSTDFITTFEHALAPRPNPMAPPVPAQKLLATEVSPESIKEIKPAQGWTFACERVRRFCRRRKMSIWDFDFVCWPCNYVTAHWVLIVADLKQRRLLWMDSYQDCYLSAWASESKRASHAAIRRAVEAEHELKGLFQDSEDELSRTAIEEETDPGKTPTRQLGLPMRHQLTRHRVRGGSRILGATGQPKGTTPGGDSASPSVVPSSASSTGHGAISVFRDDETKELLLHTGWIHFECVERYLRWDYEKQKSEGWTPSARVESMMEDPTPWPRVIVQGLPQQEKLSLDCGVYVGHFARCLGQFGDPSIVDFTSAQIRTFREMMAILIARGEIHSNPQDLQTELNALRAAEEISAFPKAQEGEMEMGEGRNDGSVTTSTPPENGADESKRIRAVHIDDEGAGASTAQL